VAIINDYYCEQIKEIVAFDLKLIERMLDYTEDKQGAEKLKLDLEAIRFDLGIVEDMINDRASH